MNSERTFDTAQRIHPHDGYQSEPIFKGFGDSEFPYDFAFHVPDMDTQCRIPIRPIEEIKKELGISN